jgi:hypothetical protein
MSVVCWLSLWGGIYMCKWDLHRLGEVGLVPGGGRLDKSHGRPIRWSGLHRPPTFNTNSSFSSSCRHVATKAWVEQPQTLAGRPAPGSTRPRV